MFVAPVVPGFTVSVFLHERAEKRVITQPAAFALAKGIEARRVAFLLGAPARKPTVSLLQQTEFQSTHAIMFHAAFAELVEIDCRYHLVEIFLGKVCRRS